MPETSGGILVKNPAAPVWLRDIQVQCHWGNCENPAIDVIGPYNQVALAPFRFGDGDFVCAPDIGCFECFSQECQNACP